MSADSVSQWSRACIDADAIIGSVRHGMAMSHDLGQRVASEDPRESYSGYCRQHGLRAVNNEVFGKACVEMFGPRKRLSAALVEPPKQTVDDVGAPGETYETFRQVAEALTTEVQGPRVEPNVAPREKRRPWGYEVPDGDTWQKKVDARLGIQH
jgi:hypothetical protein